MRSWSALWWGKRRVKALQGSRSAASLLTGSVKVLKEQGKSEYTNHNLGQGGTASPPTAAAVGNIRSCFSQFAQNPNKISLIASMALMIISCSWTQHCNKGGHYWINSIKLGIYIWFTSPSMVIPRTCIALLDLYSCVLIITIVLAINFKAHHQSFLEFNLMHSQREGTCALNSILTPSFFFCFPTLDLWWITNLARRPDLKS